MTPGRARWAPILAVCSVLLACAQRQPPVPLWSGTPDDKRTCEWEEPGCMPTGDQVTQAMAAVAPAVSQCLHAARQLKITTCVGFSSSGEPFAAGKSTRKGCVRFDEGADAKTSEPCIEAALMKARLPAFKAEYFRVIYPFMATR
jgi:hypothetical protein